MRLPLLADLDKPSFLKLRELYETHVCKLR